MASSPATATVGSRRSERTALSREGIAARALELLDRDGPEALSMRRLAAELGVGTMSLYSHFGSKQELLDAVVDAAAGSDPAPGVRSGDWKRALRELMLGMRAALAKHPAAVRLRRSGPLNSPGALRVPEAAMQILEQAGFDKNAAAHAYRTLFVYTFGFAAFNAPGDADQVERQTHAALVALPPSEYPALRAAAAEAAAATAGKDVFEFGLDRILEGLEVLLTRHPG